MPSAPGSMRLCSAGCEHPAKTGVQAKVRPLWREFMGQVPGTGMGVLARLPRMNVLGCGEGRGRGEGRDFLKGER